MARKHSPEWHKFRIEEIWTQVQNLFGRHYWQASGNMQSYANNIKRYRGTKL